MHPRVEKLPRPAPDYRRVLAVLQRRRPDRVPLIELAIHANALGALLGEPTPATGDARADLRALAQLSVRAYHRLGYDVMKISAPIPWDIRRLTDADAGTRQWTDEHGGPIGSQADFERFPWPAPADVNFEPVEAAAAALPDGMALIGFSGGVLEFTMDLIGMERFMYATYDAPELIAAVIERVGQTIVAVFETYCQFDRICALWLGDDLGSKNGLLVSPDLLKKHVVPWYRRLAEVAHAHDRPFLLHSCGKTDALMPTLVEEVGIDAKHSFEDAIEPVERFIDRWAGKLAVLGGVDVNLLASGDEAAVAARTRQILSHAAPHGGYAAGSGNSIPDYVPVANYLAMVETVAAFNAAHA